MRVLRMLRYRLIHALLTQEELRDLWEAREAAEEAGERADDAGYGDIAERIANGVRILYAIQDHKLTPVT